VAHDGLDHLPGRLSYAFYELLDGRTGDLPGRTKHGIFDVHAGMQQPDANRRVFDKKVADERFGNRRARTLTGELACGKRCCGFAAHDWPNAGGGKQRIQAGA
jgi:hypothetical protein